MTTVSGAISNAVYTIPAGQRSRATRGSNRGQTFYVTISDPVNATTGNATCVVTILNDD